MAILKMLSTCALYQIVGESADNLMGMLTDRVADRSRLLVHALRNSCEKAWKAVEISLAGETLWSRLGAIEDKAFRQQVRDLLDNMKLPLLTERKEFRQLCLRELREAKQKGLLLGKVTPEELARSVGPFAPQGDQAAVVAREQAAIQEMAAVFEREQFKNLAWLVGQEVQGSHGLLVLAVKYYFRREVETHEQLARSLEFTRLEGLSETQAAGFHLLEELLRTHGAKLDQTLANLLDVAFETRDVVLDLAQEQKRQGDQLAEVYHLLHDLLEQARLHERREVRPGDSCSLRGPHQLQRVQELLTVYHALPEQTRNLRPALLNSVALLQVAAGQTQAAQQKFEQLATIVISDPSARARACHNVYQSALEGKDYPAALAALCEAVALDPDSYSPFPFGEYVPRRILGAGGFGVAFLCEHDVLKRPVVIKAVRLDSLELHVEDVFREAQTLNDLDHPAIIRLRECRFADAAKARPYLVTDYFDSVSLSEHVRANGPLTPAELLPVAKVVAEALLAAHAQGILHRDVKPDNVLVRREAGGSWKVKLIDFGLSVKQELLEATVRTTETPAPVDYAIAGTIDYAAPEQMGRLPAQVGTWSDVYGFARTCYFALLGTPAPDDAERETLDERWRRLLSHCTARKIENRVRTFAEVLECLRAMEDQPAPPSRPIAPAGPKPVSAVSQVPSPAPLRAPGTVPPRYLTPPQSSPRPSPVGPLFGQPLTEEQHASDNETSGKPKQRPLGGAFGSS